VIYLSNQFDWRFSFIFAGGLGLLWLVPWPALRRAEGLRDMMDALYQRVGGAGTDGPAPPLPKPIERSALRFRTTTMALYDRLQREREELSRLDEAA